ncbi:P-loop containing nucleoside triphosphate hydrolase protein, partial [Corynascus novoguineensis]
DRIVVDECHTVLDSGAGGTWRSRVLGLRGLVKAEAQMVYLTATLRPADEAEFGRIIGLPGMPGAVRWFRAPTTRKNVRYEVWRYDGRAEKEEDMVAALVEEKKAQYGAEGKIVVYCDTVKKAEQYARRLGAACYHRNAGSAEAKRAIVQQLSKGTQQQVFTATNALGLGVDAPSIRAVIHVGVVRRLRDYAQESGRAGRDGRTSEAIIVRAVRYDRRGRPIEETAEQAASGTGVERAMWEFIETKGCVRAVLDREMDGREDRIGCEVEAGEQACYRCEERARAATTSHIEEEGSRQKRRDTEIEAELQRARIRRRIYGQAERRRQADEAVEVEQFQGILDTWSAGCQWCRAIGEGEAAYSSHTLFEGCQDENAEAVQDMVKQARQAVKWAPYSCCFQCGIPQAICQRFEPRGGSGGYRPVDGRTCQYRGVLIEMVVSLWGAGGRAGARRLCQWIQAQGGEVGEDDEPEEWVRWMGRKVWWGGIESNEMCRAAVQLWRWWQEGGE